MSYKLVNIFCKMVQVDSESGEEEEFIHYQRRKGMIDHV